MTGPIPIEPVHISPQFVPNQSGRGIELLLQALQHRQELDLKKKQLQRELEQFELNKKLAGPQLDSLLLENEKKKRELRRAQEILDARSEGLRQFTGSLPHIDDSKAMGEVIAGIKDPDVAAAFNDYLKDYWTREASRQGAQPNYTEHVVASPTSPTGYTYAGINQKNPGDVRQTGQAAPNPQAPTQRIPVVTEREKASAAVNSIRGNATLNRIEATDPSIGTRVAQKVAIRRSLVGGILKRLAGTSQEDANLMAEQQIEQSMTPQELEYYVAGKQLLSGILPGLSGKQVTAREYIMHAPAYLSMGSGNPAVIASRRKARASRIRGFAAEAGDAMAERIPELAQDGIDLSEYGLGPKPTQRTRRPENPY